MKRLGLAVLGEEQSVFDGRIRGEGLRARRQREGQNGNDEAGDVHGGFKRCGGLGPDLTNRPPSWAGNADAEGIETPGQPTETSGRPLGQPRSQR